MPDVYAVITEVESAVVERIAEILELRAADPQQRSMLDAYLSQIPFPPGARVLEVGCGPGPVARARRPWRAPRRRRSTSPFGQHGFRELRYTLVV